MSKGLHYVIDSFCFSQPKRHNLRLCCVWPIAAKLADNKTLFCYSEQGEESLSLAFLRCFTSFQHDRLCCFVISRRFLGGATPPLQLGWQFRGFWDASLRSSMTNDIISISFVTIIAVNREDFLHSLWKILKQVSYFLLVCDNHFLILCQTSYVLWVTRTKSILPRRRNWI